MYYMREERFAHLYQTWERQNIQDCTSSTRSHHDRSNLR